MTFDGFFSNATTSAVVGGLTAWIASYGMQRSFFRKTCQDDIADLLVELQAAGNFYWHKDGQDADLEQAIIRQSMRCRKKCLRYDKKFARGRNTAAIKARASTLHNALTDGAFQMASRVSEPKRIETISCAIEQLEGELDM